MWLQPQIQQLTFGPLVHHENLTLLPLLGRSAVPDDLLLPTEAFATGYFTLEDSGRIDTVFLENRLGSKVLVPSGQLFEGETQNRASRFAVIVGARSGRLPLHVSCTEEGQPLSAGKALRPVAGILAASARARAGAGESSQEAVWQSISLTFRGSSASNPTLDYGTSLLSAPLEDYLTCLGEPAPEQRGYIAAVRGGTEVYFFLDVLGSRELYARLHEMLMKSVCVEASASLRIRGPTAVSRGDLAAFLTDVGHMKLRQRPLRRGFIGTVCTARSRATIAALLSGGMSVQISAGTPRDIPDRDVLVFPRPG